MEVLTSLIPFIFSIACIRYIVIVFSGIVLFFVGVLFVKHYKKIHLELHSLHSKKWLLVIGNLLCAVGISCISIGAYVIVSWAFRLDTLLDVIPL